MNDKPRHPSGPSPSAKPAGPKIASSTKPSSSTKPNGDPDEGFDFLAPPQNASEIGRLGKYRVLKVLGVGGMGTVFMAEDTMLHRIVALKVILKSIAKKAVARDRFLREARATAAIEHDHIVTIYEVNESGDVPFLAMQFLKGMTLEDWLKAGKTLNVPQIMRVGKEIAKALAAAHASQLIHRDIKPSNIWLDATNKGRVKILDFGLARPTNEETHLTQEGMILGTPAYMSPEQARGQSIDARCDLFSLGCVLYRVCTGKLPFTGSDAMSMLLAITSDEPQPLEPIHAELPPAFKTLVMKLLAKKPEDRPASAKDVVQTIQSIERDWIGRSSALGMQTSPQTGKTGGPTIQLEKREDADPALEDSAITEMELQPSPNLDRKSTPTASGPTPARNWPLYAGLGCAMFSVMSILCCLGIAVSLDRGQVEIIAEDPIAEEFLEKNGLTLTSHHKKKHTLKLGKATLPSGGYEVFVGALTKGLEVEPHNFNLGRGDVKEVRIRFVPPVLPKSLRPEIALLTIDDAKRTQREWAAYLKRDVFEKNGLEGPMVLIPAGEFEMGTSRERLKQHLGELIKKADKKLLPERYALHIFSEAPQHRVRITKPFYLGLTEVTNSQFQRFVSATQYVTEAVESGKGGTGLEAGKEAARKPDFNYKATGYTIAGEMPVTNVTWRDAQAFCLWLSKKDGKTYRLPTEAEWEFACRAGSTTPWYFGNDLKDARAREYMWIQLPNKIATPATPMLVGRKHSNDFGLKDMHGNVAEMCSDYWGPLYYERSPKNDPKGPEANAGAGKIIRGGSIVDSPYLMRSAYRGFADPSLGYATVGFRIVCEIVLPAEDADR